MSHHPDRDPARWLTMTALMLLVSVTLLTAKACGATHVWVQ